MSGEGFLSRWSKRKAEQVATEPSALAAPTGGAESTADQLATNPITGGVLEAKVSESARQSDTLSDASSDAAQPKPPLPTIESLTNESDFTPFMARDVSPDMRNQAMRKLFTDPHYNIMDGLDTYIDDYGKPDPLPEGWLEMMNQSKTLRLFETKEEEAARLGVEANTTGATQATQAPLGPATPHQAAQSTGKDQSRAVPDEARLTLGADTEGIPAALDPSQLVARQVEPKV